MDLTTLRALLRIVRHGFVNHLATDEFICICGKDGFHIIVFFGMVQQWIDMGIFRVLRGMHWSPILALLATAWFVEVAWDASGDESLPFS